MRQSHFPQAHCHVLQDEKGTPTLSTAPTTTRKTACMICGRCSGTAWPSQKASSRHQVRVLVKPCAWYHGTQASTCISTTTLTTTPGPSRQSWAAWCDCLSVSMECVTLRQDVLAYVQGDILDKSAAIESASTSLWFISNGHGTRLFVVRRDCCDASCRRVRGGSKHHFDWLCSPGPSPRALYTQLTS